MKSANIWLSGIKFFTSRFVSKVKLVDYICLNLNHVSLSLSLVYIRARIRDAYHRIPQPETIVIVDVSRSERFHNSPRKWDVV